MSSRTSRASVLTCPIRTSTTVSVSTDRDSLARRHSSRSRFTSSIDALTTVGPYDAVVPAVAGQAWITGFSQMGLHPTDPYPQGFTVADTWMQEFSLLAG